MQRVVRERHHQHQVITAFNHVVELHMLQLKTLLGLAIKTNGIAVQQRCAEAPHALGEFDAELPHSHDANGAVDHSLGVEIGPPSRELACAHEGIPCWYGSRQADQHRNGEFCRWCRQQIGDELIANAPCITGGEIEIVETTQGSGDRAQPRAVIKKVGIDAIRHEHQQAIGVRCRCQQSATAPGLPAAIGGDPCEFGEEVDDFLLHIVRDHEMGPLLMAHEGRHCTIQCRRALLIESSAVTTTSTTSSRAETCWYSMIRRALMISKPMPPAPTAPTTIEARKLYSQR